MKILYIGDVTGKLGVDVVAKVLPELKQQHNLDLVIAQAENVTDGRGMSIADFNKLQSLGVDFFTGGNWSMHLPELHPYLNDPDKPVIRPANYPDDVPGKGYKYLQLPRGAVLVVSLLGQIVGKDADKPVENPLLCIDKILEETKHVKKLATIVNFHGDYSSEKFVIGRYLDGKVTVVVGDHWHVPTADASILPKQTAHITDVGMTGSLDSCLGVDLEVIINRWYSGKVSRNIWVEDGRLQFNAVLIESDDASGLAKSIQHIRIVK